MVAVRNAEGLKKKRKLVCFPYAGGSASFYTSWMKKFAPDIEVCAVQLPGREELFRERSYLSMQTAVSHIAELLRKHVDEHTVFFGHSMGAKIAYETALSLEKEGKPIKCLIASGSGAPSLPPSRIVHNLPDEEIVKELRRLAGTPGELMENEDLLKYFLPMIRADFTMDETYRPKKKKEELSCSLCVFGGDEDEDAGEEILSGWEEYTRGEFKLKMFRGNHFYLKEAGEEFYEAIREVV